MLSILNTKLETDFSCKLDLGLVVDTSQSIKQKNINDLKTILENLVQQFDISNDGTHISLETFGDKSVIHKLFDEPDFFAKKSLTSLIDKGIDKLSRPTRLDLALEKADLEMFTEENGDRHGVRSVMVLFTDGRSHPKDTDKKKYREHFRNIKHSNSYEAQGLDVAFAVDKTRSVEFDNFRLVKGFILQLIDALTIGPEETHTGLILFAKQARVISISADNRDFKQTTTATATRTWKKQ
ncbi:Integrin alpha-1 [Stylophora pistillata]|uniref:Integrin alpha-1 n=1 Tax=Stylophora pistillata TaxID=50429 RepID=A0A2B4SX97_STYPI|nr:Integrin alpha-1 [Stylophora pistillata]